MVQLLRYSRLLNTIQVQTLGLIGFRRKSNLHKALSMPQFTIRVDDFLVHFESLFATGTAHVSQGSGRHRSAIIKRFNSYLHN